MPQPVSITATLSVPESPDGPGAKETFTSMLPCAENLTALLTRL